MSNMSARPSHSPRGATAPTRRPGRPDTAARIWQDRRYRHALVKLYLYTTLSTEDIGRLITELARKQTRT